jgi:uncharacterized protein (DUF433 family)
MDNQNTTSIIGLGVYTLQEASLYSKISSKKLSRWLYGSTNALPIIKSQLYEQHLVSFLDLIQSKAIAKAHSLGISLQRIRQAIAFVTREYNIDFPLAHKYALVEFGNELHIQNKATKIITQVTGNQKKQELMTPIVSQFLQNLEFNAQDLAEKYTPFENNGIKIILNPKVQFGQPLVGNTGYRADILYKAYLAEDSYKSVADEFAVEIDDIKTAILYMNSLKVAA